MKVLALDFDGVIANTIIDNFFTSFNVYLKFNPGTQLLNGIPLTFDNVKQSILQNKDIFKQFRSFCSFVTKANQYIIAFYIIERKEKVRNQLEFDVFCKSFHETTLNSFQDEFYVERKRLQSLDLDKWYGLSAPFKDIIAEIKKLTGNIFLVTNRDKDSTIKLTGMFDLTIDEDKIIHKDFGINKAEKLTTLSEKLNIGKQDIVFVDDILKHVLAVKQAGFNAFLATWGFSTEEQQKFAEQNGICLLTKENFYEIISSELEK